MTASVSLRLDGAVDPAASSGRSIGSAAQSKNARSCNLQHSTISEFGLVKADSCNDESKSSAGAKKWLAIP
jgi:hypothetical protein